MKKMSPIQKFYTKMVIIILLFFMIVIGMTVVNESRLRTVELKINQIEHEANND